MKDAPLTQANGHARRSSVDGGRVSIEGPADFSTPWASFADLARGTALVQIGTGPENWGFEVAAAAGVVFNETYDYRNGRLYLGEQHSVDPVTQLAGVYRLAVWVVGDFSMKTHGYQNTDALIAFLENFETEGRSDGFVLHPRSRSVVSYVRSQSRAPSYVQNVPGVGLIEVKQLTGEKRKAVPSWAGARARGGSLYVEDRDSPDWTLLLVGGSAVTRCYPNYWEASSDEIIDKFSETVVEWR